MVRLKILGVFSPVMGLEVLFKILLKTSGFVATYAAIDTFMNANATLAKHRNECGLLIWK